MSTDFLWFAHTLNELRRYRTTASLYFYYNEWVHRSVEDSDELPIRKWFSVTQECRDFIEVEGTHSMNPGCETGAQTIETALNVELPTDLHDFYKIWGGGFLMLSDIHYIMNPAEVINVALRFRELNPDVLGFPLIRFCSLWNGDFVALVAEKSSQWKIIFTSHEYSEMDILCGPSGELGIKADVASSFSDWLRRTVESDGTCNLTAGTESIRLQ